MTEFGSRAMLAIVFTDLEASSELWREEGEAVLEFLGRHFAQAEAIAASLGGSLVKTQGDATVASFAFPLDALGYCQRLHESVNSEPLRQTGRKLRMRAGAHFGMVSQQTRDGRVVDLFGDAMNKCSRVCDAANGGQTFFTAEIFAMAGPLISAASAVQALGSFELKGVGSTPLYRVDFPGLPPCDMPPRVAAPARDLTPDPPREFVGRSKEAESVSRLLLEPAGPRLVAVHGPGGVGKTTLAIHVSRLYKAAASLPVVWASLEAARSCEEAAVLVARAAGLDAAATSDHWAMVGRWAAGFSGLLVMDNLEQLPQAGMLADELLSASKGMRVLATSRHLLQARHEHPIELEGLTEEDAAELFRLHAQRLKPGLALTPADRESVKKLAKELDCLPLGIELAASRVRSMTPRQIAQRIGSQFELLSSGDEGAPDRQRTLAGAIAWSVNLLQESQMDALVEACSFPTAFPLEVFEDASSLPVPWAALEELCSRSLAAARQSRHTERMLFSTFSSVRSYVERTSAEKWAEAANRTRAAYRRRLRTWRAQVRTDSEREALACFAEEAANAGFAVRLGRGEDSGPEAWQAWADLAHLAVVAGLWQLARETSEGLDWAAMEASPCPEACDAALERGGLLLDDGRLEEAERWAEFARSCAPGQAEIARADNLLGLVAKNRGDWSRAIECYQAALSSSQASGDQTAQGIALNNLAVAFLWGLKDLDQAARTLAESTRLRQWAGDHRGLAECQTNMGIVLLEQGRLPESLAQYILAWRQSQAAGDRYGEWRSAANAAEALIGLGRRREALECLAFAGAGFDSIGSRTAGTVKELARQAESLPDNDADPQGWADIAALTGSATQP